MEGSSISIMIDPTSSWLVDKPSSLGLPAKMARLEIASVTGFKEKEMEVVEQGPEVEVVVTDMEAGGRGCSSSGSRCFMTCRGRCGS
jgi:hypothetical protein